MVAYRKQSGIKLRHTSGVHNRMRQHNGILGAMTEGQRKLVERLTELSRRQLQRPDVQGIMDRLFPTKEGASQASQTRRESIVEQILQLYEQGGNDDPSIRGSALNLYNGITEYVDHHRAGLRTVGQGRDILQLEEVRAQNSVWGTGADLKQRALDVILEATTKLPSRMDFGNGVDHQGPVEVPDEYLQ